MKHKFFNIPVLFSESAETELNCFCDSHRIANIEKQFVADGANSRWAICVTWLEQEGELAKTAIEATKRKKPKVDYKEILSEADFEWFSELRDLRTTLAAKEGTPVYNIFTNEQLATMVENRITTRAGLLALEGVGQTKIDKYSDVFLQHIQQRMMSNAPVHQP